MEAKLQCRVIEYTAAAPASVAFDATDTRGRQIGAAVQKFEMRRIRQNKGAATAFCRAGQFGKRYGFDGWGTRGGEKYGAGVYGREYGTAAERDAAAAGYLQAARQRAARHCAACTTFCT